VPDRAKLAFVIFDIRALWRSDAQPWASECPDVLLNPVCLAAWHGMLYSHMATVGVKGLNIIIPLSSLVPHIVSGVWTGL